MTPSDKRNRGFTLIETLVVILMSMTLMAISIFQLQPSMQLFRSRAATDQVKSTLRQARELAISERRSVVPNCGTGEHHRFNTFLDSTP